MILRNDIVYGDDVVGGGDDDDILNNDDGDDHYDHVDNDDDVDDDADDDVDDGVGGNANWVILGRSRRPARRLVRAAGIRIMRFKS